MHTLVSVPEFFQCTKCLTSRPIADFYKKPDRRKNGTVCRFCLARRRRDAYHADPAVRAAQIASTQKWQNENREHYNATALARYYANKERFSDKRKPKVPLFQAMLDAVALKDHLEVATLADQILLDSHATEAIFIAGMALLSLKKKGAIDWLHASALITGNQPDWIAASAGRLVEKQAYAAAMRLLGVGRDHFPDHPGIRYLEAFCSYGTGFYEKAIEQLDDLLDLIWDVSNYEKIVVGQTAKPSEVCVQGTQPYRQSRRRLLVDLAHGPVTAECRHLVDDAIILRATCHARNGKPDRGISELLDLTGEDANNARCRIWFEQCQYQKALDALSGDSKETLFHKGILKLGLGQDWPNAWKLYRYGDNSRDIPRAQSLDEIRDKHLVLFHNQGLGDTIQFIRFATFIRPYVRKLTIEVPQEIVRLVAQGLVIEGDYNVIALDADFPAHDVAVTITDCPDLLGTTIATIPNEVYFKVPRTYAMFKKSRVGVVWAGASKDGTGIPLQYWHVARSMDFDMMKPLFDNRSIDFVSLQLHSTQTVIEQAVEDNFDMLDTAQVIMELDLVITIDSAVAHLAGALGVPVWLLSRYDGCWRWFWDKSEYETVSPWYPSMRIFRQSAPDTWPEVIERVALALQVAKGDWGVVQGGSAAWTTQHETFDPRI
jgi:tetratricopeptide (TPR) repeat protein